MLSYFNDNVFIIFINGLENVILSCFIKVSVDDWIFKFDKFVVWLLIKLKNVVLVALILLIFNIEFVDNEFKLENIVDDVALILFIDVVWPFTNPNNVVLVALILFIDSTELVDNEFKLENIVDVVAFKLDTDVT